MKAVIISKKGKIEYEEVREPRIKNNYIKVKVKAAGLCGSDIQKIFSDKKALKSVETKIWGHEISGVIQEVGEDVKYFKKGDRVVINPLVRKRKNDPITEVCSIGKNFPGGFAEYVLVDYRNLRKISPKIGFKEAVLADSIASAFHAYHLSHSPINKSVLILGDGPLALITSILCAENNEVTLMGKNIRNLKLASELGIETLKEGKLKNSNKKFDVVFEVVGRRQSDTLNQAIKNVKPNGLITILGVFEKDFYGKILLRALFYKEIKMIGSNSYGFFNKKDEFNLAIEFLKKQRQKLSKIITHVIPLKDFKAGLDIIKDKEHSKVIKIVFEP